MKMNNRGTAGHLSPKEKAVTVGFGRGGEVWNVRVNDDLKAKPGSM